MKRPDIEGFAERIDLLVEWADLPMPKGFDALTSDIANAANIIHGGIADDVPALLAYVAELERGIETQAATIRGLESMLAACRSRLPSCGKAVETGLCGALATVRGHVESVEEACDADPQGSNSMPSRPWVDRCDEHAAGLYDARPIT